MIDPRIPDPVAFSSREIAVSDDGSLDFNSTGYLHKLRHGREWDAGTEGRARVRGTAVPTRLCVGLCASYKLYRSLQIALTRSESDFELITREPRVRTQVRDLTVGRVKC